MEKSGTREWSDHSENAGIGCEHGCLYCYARYDRVDRFHKCTNAEWSIFQPNNKRIDGNVRKLTGRVMFPTTHDITPKNLDVCMILIRKHLEIGNELLITSKPHWHCITTICENFHDYKQQITFRFTIGSSNNMVLKFWEPGAPTFAERRACLQYAFDAGYKTSVSCEPMLDIFPHYVFDNCKDHITDSFWIGLLRNWKSRVKLQSVPISTLDSKIYNCTKATLDDKVIKTVHMVLQNEPLVKWKDSARKVLGL
jgi:hypothetical protein